MQEKESTSLAIIKGIFIYFREDGDEWTLAHRCAITGNLHEMCNLF